jgi:hypothetical protein
MLWLLVLTAALHIWGWKALRMVPEVQNVLVFVHWDAAGAAAATSRRKPRRSPFMPPAAR